ncbi:hypothetical protein MTR67_002602 [Solanum verrucosum]|uniref:F-box domain-containing protein n=1 Tax=Solanum verrucosum TaxID=315347 RepID=A0AAF0T626_SOLVR|nr:hypothetical protein MTR67_002602 [Solanum verrucosum]
MAGETLDDRMSELPESLVLQILSLLPTDEAFTTCILSKRWQYLWTSLNSFIFSPKRYWERSKGFRSFVDYVLSHSTASKFDKFELHCSSPHLELSHDFDDFKCSLVDVSSIVNAKITFDITCIKDFEDDYLDFDEEDEDSCRDYHEGFKTLVQDYLQKLRYATELTFGTLFSQTYCEIIFVTLVQFPLGWLVFSPDYILRLQFDDSRFHASRLIPQDTCHLSPAIGTRHVYVSYVVNAKDKSDQDSDDDEEDSYSEDHQYSDDEEESWSDYFQDFDDDQDSYSDYYG